MALLVLSAVPSLGFLFLFITSRKRHQILYGPAAGTGDIIGCGVTLRGLVYFTMNGQFLGGIAYYQPGEELSAIISLQGGFTDVHVNFGQRPFVFDFGIVCDSKLLRSLISSPRVRAKVRCTNNSTKVV